MTAARFKRQKYNYIQSITIKENIYFNLILSNYTK